MSFMRQVVTVRILMCVVLLGALASSHSLHAQGCVVAHSVGQVGGPEDQGGYLQPGHFELTFDYRHLYSFRHFVGSVAQVYRQEGNSEVRNRVNLFDASLTYQITPRFSVIGTVPLEFASRHYYIAAGSLGGGAPGVTIIGDFGLSGAGDVSFMGQGWLWDPTTNPSHNIQLGIGVQAPTGRDNVKNRFAPIPGTPAIDNIADYSIQPGIGVWAIPVSFTGFQSINKVTQVYLNGSYLVTPSEGNGVPNPTFPGFPPPAPQNSFISAADEYLVQVGFAYSTSLKGLTASLGLREEGVPAHDLIGGNEGFRRPGYAVSLEPGIIYTRPNGHDIFTANIDRALYRNRVASVPDLQLGTHGDAAFADWLWLASFTHRF
jgi:hypothetical protein